MMGFCVLVLYGAGIGLRYSKPKGMEEVFALWEYSS